MNPASREEFGGRPGPQWCGNLCDPYLEPWWTCPHCGVTYPAAGAPEYRDGKGIAP